MPESETAAASRTSFYGRNQLKRRRLSEQAHVGVAQEVAEALKQLADLVFRDLVQLVEEKDCL